MGAELWWVLGGVGALFVLALIIVVAVLLARSNRTPATLAVDAGKQAKAAVEHIVPQPFRTWLMAAVTIALMVAIFWLARQQIGLLLYKAVLITGAACLGYGADRMAFPYSRPHMFEDPEIRWRYEIRRAYVISAAMLTAGLGA